MTLKDVKTWGYQLQNIRPKKIAASPYDLVVIDYASDDGPFTPAQVEQMKQQAGRLAPAGHRLHEHRRGRDLPAVLEQGLEEGAAGVARQGEPASGAAITG